MLEKNRTQAKDALDAQRAKLQERWQGFKDDVRSESEWLQTLPNAGQRVSVPTAYLWFLLTAGLGGHRLYLGHPTGRVLVYALTAGYLGVGWLWDFITLPAQVRALNSSIEAAYAERGSRRR